MNVLHCYLGYVLKRVSAIKTRNIEENVEKMVCQFHPKINVTSGLLGKFTVKYAIYQLALSIQPSGMMIVREQVPIQGQYSEIQIQTQLEYAVIERKCGFDALSSWGKAS